MKSIFEYINYRDYLRDYYEEKKRTKPYFSFRFFAMRAQIKSPIFLKLVIDGKKNLSERTIERFAKAMILNKRESRFFRHLVLFNQSRTSNEKQEHYAVLRSMANTINEHVIGSDYYDYFEKWYIAAIRELICLIDFKDDFDAIGSLLYPRVAAAQAKEAVELLLKRGFVEKGDDDRYSQTEKSITTGPEVLSFAVRNFNRRMLQLAVEAVEAFPVSERHVSGLTMGISSAAYNVLVTEIEAFKERVVSIVRADDRSDKVYQLDIALFPLVKESKKRHENVR